MRDLLLGSLGLEVPLPSTRYSICSFFAKSITTVVVFGAYDEVVDLVRVGRGWANVCFVLFFC